MAVHEHGTRVSDAQVLAVERRSLFAYMYAMLVLAVAGFTAYAFTGVAATQLDGVISLINAGAAYIAARLALTATLPATAETPYGRLALENLYVLFRSLMILGVILVGLITNGIKIVEYLVTGKGVEADFGWAAVYTAGAAATCVALMFNHLRNNRSIHGASALLRVEAHAAKMESLISGGICLSLVVVAVLPEGTFLTSESFNIKDIADSIIVVVLCLVLFPEPLAQIRAEFGRLSGKRTDPDLDAVVRQAIADVTSAHGDEHSQDFTLVDVLAIRRGKVTEVDLRVSYTGVMTVVEQDEIRAHTLVELRERVGPVRVTLVFTAHASHDAPTLAQG